MKNEIEKIDPQEFGLQETEVLTIEQAFMPKIIERDALKVVYENLITGEITPELCADAKSLRNKLVKVRTGIADIHKSQKAFFLSAGRFVDAWKNKETLPVTQMEENLLEIETHYEKIEQQKIKDLQESRALELAQIDAEFIPGNLGELTEQVWSNFLLGTKTAFELKKQAEKEAQEKEEERIRLEKKKQERVRVENENLQKQLKEQQEKADQERKEQKERLRKEREGREKAEKALKEKADQERKEQEEKAAKLEFDLQKGDAAKFADLINDLEILKTKYSFKSEKNKKKYSDVSILLEKIINHIK